MQIIGLVVRYGGFCGARHSTCNCLLAIDFNVLNSIMHLKVLTDFVLKNRVKENL